MYGWRVCWTVRCGGSADSPPPRRIPSARSQICPRGSCRGLGREGGDARHARGRGTHDELCLLRSLGARWRCGCAFPDDVLEACVARWISSSDDAAGRRKETTQEERSTNTHAVGVTWCNGGVHWLFLLPTTAVHSLPSLPSSPSFPLPSFSSLRCRLEQWHRHPALPMATVPALPMTLRQASARWHRQHLPRQR